MWRHRYLEPGERYGRWTVVRYAGLRAVCSSPIRRLRYYLCRCECGREREVAGTSLTRGASLGCGCARWETRAARAAESRPALARRTPRPYVPEHPEQFTDDWMFMAHK